MSNIMNRDKFSVNTRRMSGITVKSSEQKSESRSDESNVNVAVRCRPMSEKEISDGHQSIVEFESSNRIVVHDTSESPSDQLGTKSGDRRNYSHVYNFNVVFDCASTQKDIYDRVCRPIVDSVLEGYNGTIFAYGQTGTGKTYTMEGISRYRSNVKRKQEERLAQSRPSKSSSMSSGVGPTPLKEDYNDFQDSSGIIPRAFKQIFNHIAKSSQIQFLIRASYLEIYQEEIHDLLRKDRSIKLELHERPDIGVYVKGLTSFVCKSITEIERVMKVGNQNRMVGATDMNEHSSRSHAIFMITVEQQSTIYDNKQESKNKNVTPLTAIKGQEPVIRVGKLNLVDLAGSERQRKTNSFGQRQRESIKINLSLSALGNVINSLMKIHTQQSNTNNNNNNNNKSTINITASGAGFTPYRDSKLTRLLQDSLGGNAKTLMIANIGPASYNYDETINTLNYASRAKCIRNRPRLNEDPKDALLRELQREIDDLRSKLTKMNKNNNNTNIASSITSVGVIEQVNKQNGGNEFSKDSLAKFDNENIEKELLELRQKLFSLESKLLNGDRREGNSIDQSILQGYTYEQELELERSRVELADQADREMAIRDELERREEAEMMAKESFSTIQQEVDAKKRLIRQILLKIKSMRDEIESTQKAYMLELDELDQLQYVLHKELKLKCLIMDNFIPNNHVDQLLSRIIYDEKRNCCTVTPIDLPLDYCNLNDQTIKYLDFWKPTEPDCIRPKSEFERIGETIYPGNIRYKYENLIEPKLDEPKIENRRQLGMGNLVEECDNKSLLIKSKFQTLFDIALSQREPDIVI